MTRRALVVVLTLLILAASSAAQPWPGAGTGPYDRLSAGSATPDIVVNSADDTHDGICDATHCSLRDALGESSSIAGPNTITFAIPTADPSYDAVTGVWTLQTDSGYQVPDETTVDGSVPTGPGSSRPAIEIDATIEAQYQSGLRLGADVTLRGLIVNGFGYGIWIDYAGVTIEGCYIGTDPTGYVAKPNSHDGILVARGAVGAVIQDNLISGNRNGGIRMWGDPTTGHVIRRNLIGCDVGGAAGLPNGNYGLKVHSGAHDNTIGPGNVIAFNGTYGVWVTEYLTRGNRITRNSIHSNGTWGIRLTAGGNDELARPTAFLVSRTEVVGTACADCVIQIFSDALNQGELFEGAVIADPSGDWVFSKPGGLRGLYVTATASDADGNTSEFSEPVRLPPPATATATRTPTLIATHTATPTATLTATHTATPTATCIATPTATPTEPQEMLQLYLPLICKEWG